MACRRRHVKGMGEQVEKATAAVTTALAGPYKDQWRALLIQQAQLLRRYAGELLSQQPCQPNTLLA